MGSWPIALINATNKNRVAIIFILGFLSYTSIKGIEYTLKTLKSLLQPLPVKICQPLLNRYTKRLVAI
jgi:disulfide bond formation protein DsbB